MKKPASIISFYDFSAMRCPYVYSAKCGRVVGTATESYIKGKLSHEYFPRSRLCKRCEAVSYLNI